MRYSSFLVGGIELVDFLQPFVSNLPCKSEQFQLEVLLGLPFDIIICM